MDGVGACNEQGKWRHTGGDTTNGRRGELMCPSVPTLFVFIFRIILFQFFTNAGRRWTRTTSALVEVDTKWGRVEMVNKQGDKGKACPLACFYSFYFHLANYLISKLLTNTGRM